MIFVTHSVSLKAIAHLGLLGREVCYVLGRGDAVAPRDLPAVAGVRHRARAVVCQSVEEEGKGRKGGGKSMTGGLSWRD